MKAGTSFDATAVRAAVVAGAAGAVEVGVSGVRAVVADDVT
jgi:hypothetical protein